MNIKNKLSFINKTGAVISWNNEKNKKQKIATKLGPVAA
jgi:hypothetical protein